MRVERLQEISTADVMAEVGCEGYHLADKFIALWDSINAQRGYGWDADPWVWVVSFERTEAP